MDASKDTDEGAKRGARSIHHAHHCRDSLMNACTTAMSLLCLSTASPLPPPCNCLSISIISPHHSMLFCVHCLLSHKIKHCDLKNNCPLRNEICQKGLKEQSSTDMLSSFIASCHVDHHFKFLTWPH